VTAQSATPMSSNSQALSHQTPARQATDAVQTLRWSRRKDARPGEILAAALDLFIERGYANTRAEDVAERAGISKGTLYLYFEHKEALFRAVVRTNIVPLIASSRASLESSAASSAEQLRGFLNDWWQQFGMTPLAGILKLVIAETASFPEVTRFFHDEVIEPSNQLFASILHRGIERGEFRPIDVEATVSVFTAPLVLKSIWIHSVQRCVPLDAFFPVERFLAAHCDAALRYLEPDSAGAQLEAACLADSRKPDQPSCSSRVR